MVCHDIAEILLKLALNTTQSTVFMVCIEKLGTFQLFFVVKYQRETSHARLSGRTHTLYRNIKTTKMPRCLAFIDRRKEYCSGQRLFHTYVMVRVLIIEDSTLTENCRTAIKALFFFPLIYVQV